MKTDHKVKCDTDTDADDMMVAEKVKSCSSNFFTALHGMQMRSSDENSVCPSVRLSHACIVTKR